MAELVPRDMIEVIVGTERDKTEHFARADSAEEMVFILHSQDCLDSQVNLLMCPFSLALNRGIDPGKWEPVEDVPVRVVIENGRLVPFVATPTQLVCPKCGSTDITSWEPVDTAYRGVRFFQNPDDPTDVIVDYDACDTQSGDGRYEDDLTCDSCDTYLGQKDLVPEGAPPNPEWKPAAVEPEVSLATGILYRLSALLDHHQKRADEATKENADSAQAMVERARAAGVRDSRLVVADVLGVPVAALLTRSQRYDQCDETCTVDCGHCKGQGRPG